MARENANPRIPECVEGNCIGCNEIVETIARENTATLRI